jgi:hypothetical protein
MSRVEVTYGSGPDVPRASTWAISGIWFAASMMILIGTFEILAGLGAIIDDNFFAPTHHYAFNLSVNTWGWIHMILGILMVLSGAALFRGRAWAALVALGLASLSMVANFLFLPHYPWWALTMIALDAWVIWSVTRPGAIVES